MYCAVQSGSSFLDCGWNPRLLSENERFRNYSQNRLLGPVILNKKCKFFLSKFSLKLTINDDTIYK